MGFDIKTISFGAVAQLGERLNGIQEVVSSILISSTNKNKDLGNRLSPFFILKFVHVVSGVVSIISVDRLVIR